MADDLGDKVGFIIAFHVLETLAAVLLAGFALGLFRRLRASMPEGSLVPGAAAFGLLGTSVVMVLASGLDTEFAFVADSEYVTADAAVFYNHWTGTIPGVGCWSASPVSRCSPPAGPARSRAGSASPASCSAASPW